MSDEKIFSLITVEVAVYVGRDPGVDTHDVHEPPYEYLVIREADARRVDGFHPRGVLDSAELDDLDADGVLVDTVKTALLAHRGGFTPQ